MEDYEVYARTVQSPICFPVGAKYPSPVTPHSGLLHLPSNLSWSDLQSRGYMPRDGPLKVCNADIDPDTGLEVGAPPLDSPIDSPLIRFDTPMVSFACLPSPVVRGAPQPSPYANTKGSLGRRGAIRVPRAKRDNNSKSENEAEEVDPSITFDLILRRNGMMRRNSSRPVLDLDESPQEKPKGFLERALQRAKSLMERN